jgi:serine/threonine protein kinase
MGSFFQHDCQQSGCVRRCLPEAQARRLFQQLIVAVDFLHHLGIANRDIKVCRRLPSKEFVCLHKGLLSRTWKWV